MQYGILPNLTKDYVLRFVTQEQIFEKYLGIKVELNTLVTAPSIIRTNDKKPTCSFYYSPNGKLRFRDFAGYFWGDCFDLVAFIYRLNTTKKDFPIILDTIARDFRIHKYSGNQPLISSNTIDIREANTNIKKKSKIKLEFKFREYTNLDGRFWMQGNINAKLLKKEHVLPALYIWKNGELIYNYNSKDPAYVYSFGNDNFKVYFPYRTEYKFLMNCSCIEGLAQLEPGLIGIITKSKKDVMSLRSFGLQAIAPSSETTLIKPNEWFNIKWNCEHWFSLMDYDRTGILMSKKLRDFYNIQPLFFASNKYPQLSKNFPNYNVKDFFEFVSKYGVQETNKLINETLAIFANRFELLENHYQPLNFLKYVK